MDTPAAQESLPASLLRQWAYCPRIPWIREVLGARGVPGPWVEQGLEYDRIQHHLQRDRRLQSLGFDDLRPHRRVPLRSESLGLHGVADLLLIGRDRFVVADYKLEARSMPRGTRIQLAAYAVIAQEQLGKPCIALMVLSGKPVRAILQPWTPELQREVIEAIRALRETLASVSMPPSDAQASKCTVCEHLNLCNDRE